MKATRGGYYGYESPTAFDVSVKGGDGDERAKGYHLGFRTFLPPRRTAPPEIRSLPLRQSVVLAP